MQGAVSRHTRRDDACVEGRTAAANSLGRESRASSLVAYFVAGHTSGFIATPHFATL